MLCDKILDNVCACQKNEMIVPIAESPLALAEDMYCRIDGPISRWLLVSHLKGIDCLRRSLRLTVLFIISKGFPLEVMESSSLKKKSFHDSDVNLGLLRRHARALGN